MVSVCVYERERECVYVCERERECVCDERRERFYFLKELYFIVLDVK